ncbi:MAG: acyl-CoA thioesterase [Succinivibrionaceae bacterium]
MSLYTMNSIQKVQFYDCDPMGVVWHGNYLRYLEVARGEFLDLINCSYYKIDQEHYAFPIVEEKIKYIHSLFLSDTFTVVTHLDEYENRLVHSFEIICNDKICVKARTVQVAIDKESRELSFFMPKFFIDSVTDLLNNSKVNQYDK